MAQQQLSKLVEPPKREPKEPAQADFDAFENHNEARAHRRPRHDSE